MDLLTTLNVIALVACALLFAMSMSLHRRVLALESAAEEEKSSKESKASYYMPATEGGVLQMLIGMAREEPNAERRERLYREILNRVRQVNNEEEKRAVSGCRQGSWTYSDRPPIKEEE
jgi:hypothetical protein